MEKLSLIALLFGFSLNAATISLLPSAPTIGLGEMLTVTVQIADLGDGTAPSVGTFDLDVLFEPTIFASGTATFGNGLDVLGLGTLQAASSAPSLVNLFELSFDSPSDLAALQAGTFDLAFLEFEAILVGTTSFALALNALGDENASPLAAMVIGASVTVVDGSPPAIPEPAPLLLVGPAVLLCIYLRRVRGEKR